MFTTLISEFTTMIGGLDRTLIRLDALPSIVFTFSGRFGRVLASSGSVPYSFATPLAPLEIGRAHV